MTKLFTTLYIFIFLLGIISCEKDVKIKNCSTTDDILGPYYRPNAPERNNLNVYNQTGTKLTITGTVYGKNCETPIKNANIEIWQANDSGQYDNSGSEYNFRAVIKSNSNGQYHFTSVVPGHYLNGNAYRPSHIHLKVSADKHETLITQVYFEGDPYNFSDPWASKEEAKDRIISLSTDEDGNKMGSLDIRLKPE